MTKRSKKAEAKRGRGRPSIYTDVIADVICSRLAAGESLNAICDDDDMPDESTVRGWAVDNHEGFSPKYTRARQVQAMRWADEIISKADEGSDPQRSRLQVEARKWVCSKLLPKVYGEKLDVEHSGHVSLRDLVAEAAAKRRNGDG